MKALSKRVLRFSDRIPELRIGSTSSFGELLQTIADRGRELVASARSGVDRSMADLCEDLLSSRGEASGVGLAAEVLERYRSLDKSTRLHFLSMLLTQFDIDRKALDCAFAAYQQNPSGRTAAALHRALEPRRHELIRRLNMAPGGTLELVRMREFVLEAARLDAELAAVDADFQALFTTWFNRGFLALRRIDWSTPANILEKIIRYEAVHVISSWQDLRSRLMPADRLCFAFFHPQMDDEPLIFVEVALTRETPANIAFLLADGREVVSREQATTAVFYSISNCQEGLRGISFGNFLIKQVVQELKKEIPSLVTFLTLSPVPGFAKWVDSERRKPFSVVFGAEEKAVLNSLGDDAWPAKAAKSEGLRKVLAPAAAEYFLRAKTEDGKPVDPVARFHLGNGARLERINWLADVSNRGLAQGLGLMVNYLYDPEDIEKNHEDFVNKGAVATASGVRRSLRARRRNIRDVVEAVEPGIKRD